MARWTAILALLWAIGSGCSGEPGNKYQREVRSFHPATGRWKTVGRAPLRIINPRCVTMGRTIHVVYTTYVEAGFLAYDPKTDTWVHLDAPATPPPRLWDDYEFVAMDRVLYLLIGNEVQVYDTTAPGWSTDLSMRVEHFRFAAAVHGGRIYVFDVFPYVSEVMEPGMGPWQTIAPSPATEACDTAQSDGTLILVIGGDEMWAYDPDNDVWTAAPAPPKNLDLARSAMIDEDIFVLCSGANKILSYDTISQRWRVRRPRRHEWREFGVGSSGDRIYTFGGRRPKRD